MQLEGNQWKSLRPQLVTLLFVLFVFTVPLWTPIACRLRASASVAPRNFTNLKHSPRQLPPPRAKCRYRMAAQNPRCFGRKKTEGNAKQPQSNGFVLRRALSLSLSLSATFFARGLLKAHGPLGKRTFQSWFRNGSLDTASGENLEGLKERRNVVHPNQLNSRTISISLSVYWFLACHLRVAGKMHGCWMTNCSKYLSALKTFGRRWESPSFAHVSGLSAPIQKMLLYLLSRPNWIRQFGGGGLGQW